MEGYGAAAAYSAMTGNVIMSHSLYVAAIRFKLLYYAKAIIHSHPVFPLPHTSTLLAKPNNT